MEALAAKGGVAVFTIGWLALLVGPLVPRHRRHVAPA